MFKKKKPEGYLNEVAAQNGGIFGIPHWLYDVAEYNSMSMDSKIVYALLLYRRDPAAMKRGNAAVGEKLVLEETLDAFINSVKRMLPCGKFTAKKVAHQLIDKGLVSVKTMPVI